jgi:hypothetical protein
MQTRNKTIIRLVLTGMVILNLLLVFTILIPANPAEGAVRNDPSASQSRASPAALSPMQQFQKLDQAARQFWMGLLPFWDE